MALVVRADLEHSQVAHQGDHVALVDHADAAHVAPVAVGHDVHAHGVVRHVRRAREAHRALEQRHVERLAQHLVAVLVHEGHGTTRHAGLAMKTQILDFGASGLMSF